MTCKQKVDKELKAEISLFLAIIQSNEFRNKETVSARLFWLENVKIFNY